MNRRQLLKSILLGIPAIPLLAAVTSSDMEASAYSKIKLYPLGYKSYIPLGWMSCISHIFPPGTNHGDWLVVSEATGKPIPNVIECNDRTGSIVQYIADKDGDPIRENGEMRYLEFWCSFHYRYTPSSGRKDERYTRYLA